MMKKLNYGNKVCQQAGQQKFLRGYYLSTGDPYRSIVYDAGLQYTKLARRGAPQADVDAALKTLIYYWNEWEKNACEQVQIGKERFLTALANTADANNPRLVHDEEVITKNDTNKKQSPCKC